MSATAVSAAIRRVPVPPVHKRTMRERIELQFGAAARAVFGAVLAFWSTPMG